MKIALQVVCAEHLYWPFTGKMARESPHFSVQKGVGGGQFMRRGSHAMPCPHHNHLYYNILLLSLLSSVSVHTPPPVHLHVHLLCLVGVGPFINLFLFFFSSFYGFGFGFGSLCCCCCCCCKYAFLSHTTAALLTIQPRLFLVCCEKRQRGEWVQLLPGKAQEE